MNEWPFVELESLPSNESDSGTGVLTDKCRDPDEDTPLDECMESVLMQMLSVTGLSWLPPPSLQLV